MTFNRISAGLKKHLSSAEDAVLSAELLVCVLDFKISQAAGFIIWILISYEEAIWTQVNILNTINDSVRI